MESPQTPQKDNIFLHILYRLALLIGVGILSYFVILNGKKDAMGYGMFYAMVFTSSFTIIFALVDSILLYVRKKYQKLKVNMIMFGLLFLIAFLYALYASV